MTGLILKDILVMRKSLKTYLLLILFYLILSAAGGLPISFCLSFIEVLLMVLPLSAFAYDELSHWDKVVFALPLSRRTVVKARYGFLLLLVLISAALSGLLCIFFSLTGRAELLETLASVLACLGVGMLIPAFMLPLNYKLGRERAQPFLYVFVIGGALVVFALSKFSKYGLVDLSFLGSVSDKQAFLLFAAFPLVGLAALWISFHISSAIETRKDL